MQDLFEMNNKNSILTGIEALKKNKLQEAEEIFTNLLIQHPLDPEINHFLGITFQLNNNLDNALKYFQKATEINPNFAEAHKNLGNIFYRFGRINEAEIAFLKSINLDPKLDEAKINLETILEQKKVVSWVSKNSRSVKKNNKKLNINPYITERKVEVDLLDELYKINTMELNETKDIRFGKGKCSSDLKLFEQNNRLIKSVADDISNIVKGVVNSEIYIVESFLNILQTNSGTKPHKHLAPFDKRNGLDKQKYSLTYYVSIGDQDVSEPGILKLYEPDEEILPSNGTLVIIPSGRTHSSSYNGKKDRVMIGVNFYSLN